ncbi:hypothetical protein [Nonomuraea dietziae]|uniref:hypothetical protein n=1 Tax=Nonomuraea dietziae TaxID=65515 RepID=UPI0033DAB8CF
MRRGAYSRPTSGFERLAKRFTTTPQLTPDVGAAANEPAHAVQGPPLVEAACPAMVSNAAVAELVNADTTDASLTEAVVLLSARIPAVVYVRLVSC